jgi:DNA topoisomerase-6 subunit B
MRFANRAPLLFDAGGCAITQTVKDIDWKRYELRNFDEEPVALLVHVVSVHVPYTSAGKQSVSAEDDLVDEIRNAVMEAGRQVQKHLSGKRRDKEKVTKKAAILRYVNQISGDLSELADEEKKKEKLRASLERMVNERFE